MAQDQVVNDQVIQVGLMALQDEKFFMALVANPAEAIADMQQHGQLLEVSKPAVDCMVRLMEEERTAGTRTDERELRGMWQDFHATSRWEHEWCHLWFPPPFHPGSPSAPPTE